MLNDKHAQGTWSLGEVEPSPTGGLLIEIDAPEHGALAVVVWQMEDDVRQGTPSVACQANAKLLCAAPVLLKALRQARFEFQMKRYDWATAPQDHRDLCAAIDSAIALATP